MTQLENVLLSVHHYQAIRSLLHSNNISSFDPSLLECLLINIVILVVTLNHIRPSDSQFSLADFLPPDHLGVRIIHFWDVNKLDFVDLYWASNGVACLVLGVGHERNTGGFGLAIGFQEGTTHEDSKSIFDFVLNRTACGN